MTKEDYLAGVDWIAIKRPDHPLLRSLKQGISPINILYLQHTLKEVGEPEDEPDHLPDQVVDETDPQLIIMYKERRQLFTRRARLSNSFHECHTDTERATVSDDIRFVQKQIGRLLRQIHIFKTTGEIHDAEDEMEIPENGVELMKRRNSVRSNISTKKKALERSLYQTGDKIERQRKKWENRLKELQHELILIERKIARQSI